MNRPPSSLAPDSGETFVLASGSGSNISWLVQALQRTGVVVPVTLTTASLDERIGALAPQAVFLDFSNGQADAATEAFRHVRRDWPSLPILGMGSSAEPADMLSALRAGVDDFIDVAASVLAVETTMTGLLARRTARLAGTRGRTLAILGARAGLGVTTLATNLTLLLQDAFKQQVSGHGVSGRGVALLDLGLPARDGLLYLDTQSTFSFVDGVHNLRRLDQTLVQTAFAHHSSGTAVLPLPSSLAQVREISHADSAALIRRMTEFFDFQVADLGGFSTVDFIAQTVQEADQTWIVCDQSIGAIVSTANLLRELQARGLEPQRFGLVVNKLDSSVGISARDIAARLQLTLKHVLPMRRAALLNAGGRGEMLARVARNDPYVVAVNGMVKALQREFAPVAEGTLAAESPWGAFMAQLTGKWKSSKET
jgi:pilus assembly protein CpaE